jgi:hypothetical protein
VENKNVYEYGGGRFFEPLPEKTGGNTPENAPAITSMILGILSVTLCAVLNIVLAPIAIGLGTFALLAKKPGRGKATTGIVTGVVSLTVLLGIVMQYGHMYPQFKDLVENNSSYIEIYQEDGTYPPFVQTIENEFNETAADTFMKQWIAATIDN